MTIFNWISMLGGLAFFLYGMNIMSASLEKVAGGSMEKRLRQLTSSKTRGVLLGAGITAVIQSSSAMTVMLVALANSGIMTLEQTVPTLLGSNIGTTMTAWILSLTGINSTNFFVSMLKPENFAPIIAIVCVFIQMVTKKQKTKDVTTILIAFALLMSGMATMSTALNPIGEVPAFRQMLIGLKNPILGVLFGMVFTALLQSSSAVSGIIQALSLTGFLTYGITIPVIMGLNIGTCITAVIASIGTTKNAKRVACVHVSFNVICTIVFLSIWLILDSIFHFALTDEACNPVGIAIVHTSFNVLGTLMLLPFTNQLCKLAGKIIPDSHKKGKHRRRGRTQAPLLDENLLTIPAFAVNKSYEVTKMMADAARDAVLASIPLIGHYDEETDQQIAALEDKTDKLEDQLEPFIIKISKEELSDHEIKKVYKMLHSIPDFERLADHAVNLTEISKDISNKGIEFSHLATQELQQLYRAVEEILKRTIEAYDQDDIERAKTIEPLEEVIDGMSDEIKSLQVKRLSAGNVSVEIGFIMTDLLTNLERIGDHCSNIAVALIEGESENFDHHDYLDNLKNDNQEFLTQYADLKKEYGLQPAAVEGETQEGKEAN